MNSKRYFLADDKSGMIIFHYINKKLIKTILVWLPPIHEKHYEALSNRTPESLYDWKEIQECEAALIL